MDEQKETKREGFEGQWMYVLPTEAFGEYVEHPLVKRLYLTDVGFFPRAARHYRERKEGIEEYIYIYCMDGMGTIELMGKKTIELHANQAFCIPAFCGHRYFSGKEQPWSILWVHFKGDDVQNYPLDQCRVVEFETPNLANRMMYLFDLLLYVMGGNYTLGNFIYSSQVLQMILAETYYREKQ